MAEKIHLHGLKELDRALAQISSTALAQKALENALFDAAQLVQKDAKKRVPEDKGTLKKAIRRYRGKDGKGRLAGVSKRDAVVYVGTKATRKSPVWYAHFVEFGTAGHVVALSAKAQADGATTLGSPAGFFGKRVSVKARAHPFLRPAFDENKVLVLGRFKSALVKRIEQTWAKQVKRK